MNLSEWPVQPAAKPALAMGFLMAACADVTSRRMPPAAYRSMHAAARLQSDQAQALCDWTSGQTLLLRIEAKRRRALFDKKPIEQE
jgi:Haem-binding domain